jgi:predicted Zn-dependent protease
MALRAASALAAVPFVAALAACSTNPATGRTQFDLLSREQEIAIGAEATPGLIQEFGGQIPSADIQAYVNEVGHRVAATVEPEYADIPWEFHAVNSPIINAFALPGGQVFITRGMLEAMDNEAQLAGVLAHEIGHVTARHVNERVSQQTGIGLGGAVIGAVIGDGGISSQVAQAASQIGGDLLLRSFSRDQEHEADQLGLRYMTRAGYSAEGMLQVMQILESQGGGGPEWLSTHPNPGSRMEDIRKRMAEYPGGEFYADRFRQRAIAPLSSLAAPRQ